MLNLIMKPKMIVIKSDIFLMEPYFLIKTLHRDMQCLFVEKVKIIVEICSLIVNVKPNHPPPL